MPQTLSETYTNIIARIDEEYIGDALTVFQWLIYCRRILRLDEIAEVLAIEYDREPKFSPEFRLQDARDILSVCSSTITIVNTSQDSSLAEVSLSHASVRDFLLAGGVDSSAAPKSSFEARVVHEKIAHSCLAYLLYLGSPGLDEASIAEAFPLADYAARHWMIHAKEAEESNRIYEMALKLLRRNEDCFNRLLQLHDIDRPWRISQTRSILPNRHSRYSSPPAITQVSPLYYASLVGLPVVVRSLLRREEDPNEKCGLFGSALAAAASQGHEAIVEDLLQNGAEANTRGGFQQGPLMAAATIGHERIVELLLEKGADAGAGHYRAGNALLAGIRNGHEGVVRLLVKHGINVNRPVGKGSTPLREAVSHGHEKIVKLLLEAGANCYQEHIQLAAAHSHESVVNILTSHLTRGRQLEDTNSAFGMPSLAVSRYDLDPKDTAEPTSISLLSAAAGGLENTVRELLDSGGDINFCGKYRGGTVLRAAAARGHVAVVKLLLQRGADINLQPRYYDESPLNAAARHGHLPVVRLLLNAEPPASLAVKEDAYGNPLESAAQSGDLAVFQEILSHNPDVNAVCTLNGQGSTALEAAAAVGHETMVQLLLDRGADVNLVPSNLSGSTSHQYTPLASAAYGGHTAVAKLLLDAGADIKLVSGWQKHSPLAVAVSQRQMEMAIFLLDRDNDPIFDEPALSTAVSRRPEDVDMVRLLLGRWAEINKQFSDTHHTTSTSLTAICTNALVLAANRDHASVLKELLQHGANVNGQDHRGYTALHEAAENGSENLARILVEEYHADLHAKLLNGSFPIHIGAQSGRDECVKFFLSKNVDINCVNDERRTPLHTAVDNRRASTVRVLVAAGARLDLVDQHDMTPLDLAEFHVAKKGNLFAWDLETFKQIVKILTDEWNKQHPENAKPAPVAFELPAA